jgi:hypothetical protein
MVNTKESKMSKSAYTIFMALRARPEWLRLSRQERSDIAEEAMATALDGLQVRIRHFDAEAFSSLCSDISLFETDDLEAYYFAIERLRDSAIFSKPYFDVVAIVPALEDGFRNFEARQVHHVA